MKTMKSFIKEVVARITGDAASVIAEKNYRKAVSAVEVQIKTLEAKQVDKESAVETAQENLDKALYPDTLITDNNAYIRGIKAAQEALDNAIEAVEDTEYSIQAWKDILEAFNEEVAE